MAMGQQQMANPVGAVDVAIIGAGPAGLTAAYLLGKAGYSVTVIGVKRQDEDFIHATPDTIILPGDTLVVSGRVDKIEAFSAMND